MATLHSISTTSSWRVKVAQFVPPPSQETVSKPSPFFRRRHLSSGTWLPSQGVATVTLSSSASASTSPPSIAIILEGNVHEEHFLSSLAFTWPRFRDLNGESASPGNVVFGSYVVNETSTKRKFAMRFETVSEAECFSDAVKQLMAGIHEGPRNSESDIQNAQSSLTSGINRFGVLVTRSCLDNDGAFMNSHDTNNGDPHQTMSRPTGSREIVPLSGISFEGPTQSDASLQTSLNGEKPYLCLPPRFPPPELQEYLFGERLHHSQHKTDKKGQRFHTRPDDLCREEVTKEKLMACLLDPEFQGFMEQVEKALIAMEEDLATEISSINP